MRVVEILRSPSATERARLVEFVEGAAEASGARPLSDHLWLDLLDERPEGLLVVVAADSTGVVGMAQISSANASSSLEAVIRPDVADGGPLRRDLVDTAVEAFRFDGGGRLRWWLDDADDTDVALAGRLGLAAERELFLMRLQLPIGQHATIPTRAFRPGDDDRAWVQVNNRAFAEHGEQGGWTLDTLTARMAEPWFDPEGFRIHERDGRIVGFCWTKLHDDLQPIVGEIYVIAVDPDFHGTGLGKQLTLAGLDSITGRDVTAAMLYVDADNTQAVSLYQRLGFSIEHTRLAYSADLTGRAA